MAKRYIPIPQGIVYDLARAMHILDDVAVFSAFGPVHNLPTVVRGLLGKRRKSIDTKRSQFFKMITRLDYFHRGDRYAQPGYKNHSRLSSQAK